MTDRNTSHTAKEHESLSERVLERIGTEHIEPRSRLSFRAQNVLFWALGFLSLALGALASSAALFELANADWSFYAATHPGLLTFVLAAAPFLWLLALALFILIGYENIRRTRRGYRYPFALIVAGAVLTSVLLGAALFAGGFGERIEESIGDHPPFYRPVELEEHAWWLAPARGLLGGQVLEVSSTSDSFVLKDFNGSVWTIDASNLSTTSLAAVERGGVVRVEGVPDPSATSSLTACSVSPWETYGADTSAPPSAPFNAPAVERSPQAARIESCKGTRPYGPSQDAPNGD